MKPSFYREILRDIYYFEVHLAKYGNIQPINNKYFYEMKIQMNIIQKIMKDEKEIANKKPR